MRERDSSKCPLAVSRSEPASTPPSRRGPRPTSGRAPTSARAPRATSARSDVTPDAGEEAGSGLGSSGSGVEGTSANGGTPADAAGPGGAGAGASGGKGAGASGASGGRGSGASGETEESACGSTMSARIKDAASASALQLPASSRRCPASAPCEVHKSSPLAPRRTSPRARMGEAGVGERLPQSNWCVLSRTSCPVGQRLGPFHSSWRDASLPVATARPAHNAYTSNRGQSRDMRAAQTTTWRLRMKGVPSEPSPHFDKAQ